MGCDKRYSHWIAEYVLGQRAELSDEQKAELEAHLQTCEGCRRLYRDSAELIGLLRDEPLPEIPPEILRQTHDSIMRAIRGSYGQPVSSSEPSDRLSEASSPPPGALPGGVRRPAGASAGGVALQAGAHTRRAKGATRWWFAAAAAVLVGLGIGWVLLPGRAKPLTAPTARAPKVEPRPPAAPAPATVAQVPVPEVVPSAPETSAVGGAERRLPLAAAFAEAESAKDARLLLQKAFESAKARHEGGDFAQIQTLCAALIAKWPGTRGALEARKLISRCYTQLGDSDKARQAFLAYAGAAGREPALSPVGLAGDAETPDAAYRRTVTTLLRFEVERLCKEQDYVPAMAYADTLAAMFPGTETKQYSGIIRARYFVANRDPESAIAEYERVASSAESSQWTKRAFLELPCLYANAGKHEKALAAYAEMMKHFPDDDTAACAYCNMGTLLMCRGPSRYAEATKAFNTVISRFPQSGYAKVSTQMLGVLNAEVMRDAGM